MKRTLLISGKRANFTTLALDVNKKDLSIVADYPGPFNVSWVEPSSSHGDVDRLVGLSEGDDSGLLYTFEIDHAQKICNITSEKSTTGAPAHFITLRDRSALALSTVLEDRRGLLYCPDLGSDRVWIFRREKTKLEVCGWLQCPPGTGARHAVLTPDEKLMYVIGELSHTVVAFDLSTSPAEDIQPIDGFAPNVVPPSVDPGHQLMMDSAEICIHPNIPNVLYVSNRWERHIAELEPHLENVPKELPPGDAIAIVLLSDDGKKVQDTRHVRTNLDTIRGMRLSDDGSYVVVCGQEGGGVEVYGIGGDRGEEERLV
ncbi:hypothetical protein J7T55_011159 [Diaporthe amygdali]|uniref:uncharacterized protein n=1 Tax=Phomopsis amygdali TaxID=1214568 RepID=UPI0022FDC6A9|nr:uncharacterized protein J7T55_011159 [Diaporthe amygdali]KAJ0104375.1 hypothetical protein J7T55_011159 [Diaporthe amygdali]